MEAGKKYLVKAYDWADRVVVCESYDHAEDAEFAYQTEVLKSRRASLYAFCDGVWTLYYSNRGWRCDEIVLEEPTHPF